MTKKKPTKKKATIHFDKSAKRGLAVVACGIDGRHTTDDRRKVTCENCKNSVAWKGRSR